MTANFDTSDIPGTFEEIPDIKAPPNKVDFDTASNFLYYTIDEARSFARISTDTWDVVTHYEEYIGIFSCINVEPGAFLYLTTVLSDSASIVFQLDITDPYALCSCLRLLFPCLLFPCLLACLLFLSCHFSVRRSGCASRANVAPEEFRRG